MTTAAATLSVEMPRKILLPALVGGCVAATLDATSAFITFGWGMPKAIAAGLLGTSAVQGGTGVWLLGLALHFFILIVAALLYGVASGRWSFLRVNYLVGGIYYGISIYLFMNLIVLPLSALPMPERPFKALGMLEGLLAHIVLVGLPIAASFRLFSKPRE
jgi:uncharacterized membrane protein YagU involved in acid resistance